MQMSEPLFLNAELVLVAVLFCELYWGNFAL